MDLRLARMRKGLSQQQLAELVGINSVSICCYESGRRSPSYKTAKKIADALDIDWVAVYESLHNDRPELQTEKEK